MKKKNYGLLVIIVMLSISGIYTNLVAQDIMQHLNYLAHKYTEKTPPATLTEWEEGRAELREKCMEIIGLNPMPEKTPLNVQFIGDRVDLGNCYFQRVLFESRPKNYVAAHLYIPKNVTFPVPAVIHVPGHSRRDKYRPHPRTYAENGFIAIGLPMVGEEGNIGAGWDACGEHGAYVGHFNWYNTGYTPVAPTVWDGIRTVDFLLTLKDSNEVKLVDESKIGMAGLSGGSGRTLWTTIADPRISCAVVNQGFTTIEHYNSPGGISSTCDIHLFYNYYGLSYSEMYSLIAPRVLLVQHGTQDKLYPNPQPVVDYLEKIYKLYDKSKNFNFITHNQAHGYSSAIWNAENNWMDKWLRSGNSPLTIYNDRFDAELTCFPNGLPSDIVNTEVQYTTPTPEWNLNNMGEFKQFKDSLMKQMQKNIIRTAFLDMDAKLETVNKEDFSEYYVEEKKLTLDEGSMSHKGYFFCKPGEKNKTVILTSKSFITKASLTTLYKDNYLPQNVNLFYIEITGTGANPWKTTNHYIYDRFAQMVGHTHASLQINDLVAAIKTIREEDNVDASGIYLWGKKELTVPVLYSAVVDSNVAGVILEDAQDKHVGITSVMASKCNTAIFNILKYADIPQVAGLVYPRKIVLAGSVKMGYSWTENLYKKLGSEKNIIKGKVFVKDILSSIVNPSTSVGYEKFNSTEPTEYSISNYPNPFNPSTTISFSLPQSGDTKLGVYNILGEEILALVDEQLSAGTYEYQFNISSVNQPIASGVYFYKFRSNDFSKTKKMLFLK